MTFLDDKSLAMALTRCYKRPSTKIAIVFSSDGRYAEFSDIMLAMANGMLYGVDKPKLGTEPDAIIFKNGSYIKMLRSNLTGEFYTTSFAKDYDEVIYDYDAESHDEIDDFLSEFKVR